MLNATTLLPVTANPRVENSNNDAKLSLAPFMLLQYWQAILHWNWGTAGVMIAALTLGVVATDQKGCKFCRPI